MKWLLILMLGAAAGGESPQALQEEQTRSSVLMDQQAQDEAMAEAMAELLPRDEAVWLDAGRKQGLVVCRRARQGGVKGSVVVLAEPETGPETLSHTARIRRSLILHGWHTYFARLPEAGSEQGSAAERVQALVSLVRKRGAEGSLLLITEGAATHWAASVADQVAVDGLVLINVPESSIDFPAPSTLLGDLTLPSLVLQEYPRDWRQEDPLGADVELHLLPRGDAGREDNRLIRKIRGWFKRRFERANA